MSVTSAWAPRHPKKRNSKNAKTRKVEKQQRRETRCRDNAVAGNNSNNKMDLSINLRRALACIPLFFVGLSLALNFTNYLNWDPVSYLTEDPSDVAIDHQTQDVFVTFRSAKRLDVLLSGFLPKTTIFRDVALLGALLIHRNCTRTGVLIYGFFFTSSSGNMKYLPLPLPANPSVSNVQPTVVTAASGMNYPGELTQTHNSIEIYVPENGAAQAGHWAVHSPPVGTDGTSAAVVALTKIRDIGSVGSPQGAAITSDDNVLLVLLVGSFNLIKKTTPMLPHSATPAVTTLTFSNTLNNPRTITLHPAQKSASDFILYVGNTGGGNILQYNSASASDSVLLTVSATHGYRPNGVTIQSNGTLIIAAENGLKTSCCVDSFDYSTQLAGYMSATCLPVPTPVPAPVPTPLPPGQTYAPTPVPMSVNQSINHTSSESGMDATTTAAIAGGSAGGFLLIVIVTVAVVVFVRRAAAASRDPEAQQQRECVICIADGVVAEYTCVPCGHCCLCEDCNRKVMREQPGVSRLCPVCHELVESVVHVSQT